MCSSDLSGTCGKRFRNPASTRGSVVSVSWPTQVAPADHWDLRLVVAVCAAGPKAVLAVLGPANLNTALVQLAARNAAHQIFQAL